jgi:hypothetical protein
LLGIHENEVLENSLGISAWEQTYILAVTLASPHIRIKRQETDHVEEDYGVWKQKQLLGSNED